MKLGDLLKGETFDLNNPCLLDKEIVHWTDRSNEVKNGSLFIAVPGINFDGHNYLNDAVQRGAVFLIVERPASNLRPEISQITVPNAKRLLSVLASRWFNHPSKNLHLIGITGTNGKTTTSYLVQHIINGHTSCGLIGTIEASWNKNRIPALNTTPGSVVLNSILNKMTHAGVQSCVMEVSSHALKQDRLSGIEFNTTVFMNLSQDHLDYHQTFDDYFASKRKLFFDFQTVSTRIVNIDDPYGEKIYKQIEDKRPVSFSVKKTADYRAENIKTDFSGTRFTLLHQSNRYEVVSKLFCVHNVYNVLAAVAVCFEMGINMKDIIKSIAGFNGVKGRLEALPLPNGAMSFVDYAHTPDALVNVLKSVQSLKRGALITVFGCGGNRDRDKRGQMGKIANEFSDHVIVTSDNPREENPQEIISDILSGIPNNNKKKGLEVVADRRLAIKKALDHAHRGDIVVILGKGHEDYQIVGREKFHFSDQEEVKEWIQSHKATQRSKSFQNV